MNPRLITEAQLLKNRQGRQRRDTRQRKWKLRRQMLDRMAAQIGDGFVLIEPKTAFDLLNGHLNRAKYIAARLVRQLACLPSTRIDSAGAKVPSWSAVPSRTLHRGNRASAFPWSNAEDQAVQAFWDAYAWGRRSYGAIFSQANAEAAGDLAFFELVHLRRLLPGIKIPRALVRPEYVVRMVRDGSGLPKA